MYIIYIYIIYIIYTYISNLFMCLNVDILLKFSYKSIFLQIQCVIIYQFLYCYLCAYRYIYGYLYTMLF